MAYNPNDFMDPKKLSKDRTKSRRAPNKNKKDDEKRNSKMALYVILAIIIIIILLLLLKSCGSDGDNTEELEVTGDSSAQEVTTPTGTGIVWEDDVIDMEYTTRDPEVIKEELNKKLEASMMTISMASYVVYEDGQSEGKVNIINAQENNYPQRVEFIRNDTNECIYKSGAVPVGKGIPTAKLDVDLDAGTYECTVYFYALDPNTGAVVGTAGAVIDILVKN